MICWPNYRDFILNQLLEFGHFFSLPDGGQSHGGLVEPCVWVEANSGHFLIRSGYGVAICSLHASIYYASRVVRPPIFVKIRSLKYVEILSRCVLRILLIFAKGQV